MRLARVAHRALVDAYHDFEFCLLSPSIVVSGAGRGVSPLPTEF